MLNGLQLGQITSLQLEMMPDWRMSQVICTPTEHFVADLADSSTRGISSVHGLPLMR